MSNNKQTMKLYTEEQVREALNAGFKLAMETDGGLNDYRELFINALTPIELPSDEEIKRKIEHRLDKEFMVCSAAFRDGAKWMRNKIQGGSK